MLQTLQNVFLPESFFTGSQAQRRRSVLTYMLVFHGACELLFYAIPHPGFNHVTHLIAVAVYGVLLALLLFDAPYGLIAHATLSCLICSVAYQVAMTGGIHSSAMVWMTEVVLSAILLLDRVAVTVWVVLVFAVNALLLWMSQNGWIHQHIHIDQDLVAWTVAKRLCVIGIAMYVVCVTQRMHRIQVATVDQSNAELERTHQALKRAQTHRDEFVASVGHELRTPMNAILGLNSLLRKELAAKPEDVLVVDHIRQSTEQLLQVVNDILDFSQLQAGKLVLHEEEFSLMQTMTPLLAHHQKKAQAKNITLAATMTAVDNMWVRGDRQRLMQVLNHLLDNAVKFTHEGRIDISVKPVNHGVLFEVTDTGIGIPAERQPQLFQSYEHANKSMQRPFGGTGLGLPICQRLVVLQGGTMGVSSAQGQGARFWFELPLRHVALQEPKAVAETAHKWTDKPIRILLVDDNAVNRMVARMMLQKCFPQADIVEASSGRIALDTLRTQHFDLALMDMIMPEMDGIQVTQILRQTYPFPVCNMPVLALTASVNPVDEDRCLASGMNDVIHKPLDDEQLMGKISKALAAHAAKVHA